MRDWEVDAGAYGSACDLTLTVNEDVLEVGFSPDPHGGPETLWFCFRLGCSGQSGPTLEGDDGTERSHRDTTQGGWNGTAWS